MSDKLLIQKIIHNLFNKGFECNYTIIKLSPQFPNISAGSDIDFFVSDIKIFIKELNDRLNNNLLTKIKIKKLNSNHYHYDIYDKVANKLLLKLDLYSNTPIFQVVKIKNNFFYDVLNNSKKKIYNLNNKNINIFIPSLYFDLILRYIEYYEFFWTGYPKDFHLSLIKKVLLNNDKKLKIFLSHINYYTELPSDFHFKYSHLIQNYKKTLKFKYYLKKIIKKFLNINI